MNESDVRECWDKATMGTHAGPFLWDGSEQQEFGRLFANAIESKVRAEVEAEQQPLKSVQPHEVWEKFRFTQRFSEQEVQKLIDFIGRQPLKPIAGPPDLDGVENGSYYVIKWDWPLLVRVASRGHGEFYEKFLTNGDKVNIEFPFAGVEWHIPLGVITPPQPEPPKCPICDSVMKITCSYDCLHCVSCDNGNNEGHTLLFWGETEAEAIEAARKAGE